jgi:hypothetical protein
MYTFIYFKPGANPTIASCNACVVNIYNVVDIYNATGSLARLKNRNISSGLKNALAYYSDYHFFL